MTKVYLVKSVKANQKGFVWETVENVFTNKKKAKSYVEWMQKDDLKRVPKFILIKYKIDEWYIDKDDYSKIPY